MSECNYDEKRDHEFEECMGENVVRRGIVMAERCDVCRMERFSFSK